MWLFVIAALAVGFVGAFCHSLCVAAGDADDAMELAFEEERRRAALVENSHG